MEKAMELHSSTLAWEIPWIRGAWWAAVYGVAKSQTRLSDFTLTFHFHALEKEMATHSSVLAWRIPATGEPGGLLSMGLHSWTQLKWLSSSSSKKESWHEVITGEIFHHLCHILLVRNKSYDPQMLRKKELHKIMGIMKWKLLDVP